MSEYAYSRDIPKSPENKGHFTNWTDFYEKAKVLIEQKRKEQQRKDEMGRRPKRVVSVGLGTVYGSADRHKYEFVEQSDGFFIRVTNTRKPKLEKWERSKVNLHPLIGSKVLDQQHTFYIVNFRNTEEEPVVDLYYGEHSPSIENTGSFIRVNEPQISELHAVASTTTGEVRIAENLWQILERAVNQ